MTKSPRFRCLLYRQVPAKKNFSKPTAHSTLSEFAVLTSKQVHDLIINVPIKSSALDPIPADIFKSCLPALLPVLTAIVKHSLQSGTFPDHLKQAQLSPILKKFNLDPEILHNYRPISNLPFIFKLIERAVAKQLTAYMAENNLFELYESAYRSNHSTETALLCVMDSRLVALDNRSQVLSVSSIAQQHLTLLFMTYSLAE